MKWRAGSVWGTNVEYIQYVFHLQRKENGMEFEE
jgi:hypothetical protein